MNQNIFWRIMSYVIYYPLNKKILNGDYVFYLFHPNKFNLLEKICKFGKINLMKNTLFFIKINLYILEDLCRLASKNGYIDILYFLFSYFSKINLTSKNSLFLSSSFYGNIKILKFLYSLIDFFYYEYYYTSIQYSCHYGYLENVQFISTFNNFETYDIDTSGHFEFCMATISSELEIVKFLYHINGYIMNDEDKIVAIQCACQNKNIKIIKFLFSQSYFNEKIFYVLSKEAIYHGNLDNLQFLYTLSNEYILKNKHYYIIYEAKKKKYFNIIKFLSLFDNNVY
jgi:hypothetical protein